MKVIVIGKDSYILAADLEKEGILADALSGSQVPSLTALLASDPEITALVLQNGQRKSWSMGHILAAAKQLQRKGCLVIMGNHKDLPALIHSANDKDVLLELLRKRPKPDSGEEGSGKKDTSWKPVRPKFRPLRVPVGSIIMIGVMGAQHRIGCTTQTIGIWHYCKALGFDPAVVANTEQISQIDSYMESQRIAGGCRVEGIPFVTDTALAYDCYILDLGVEAKTYMLDKLDCLVLVAGCKPWELQHTVAAVKAVSRRETLILLSFAESGDADILRPLFGQQTVATPPWMPGLMKPNIPAMILYDALLRPMLERAFSKENPENSIT